MNTLIAWAVVALPAAILTAYYLRQWYVETRSQEWHMRRLLKTLRKPIRSP
jgi:hypothetical protein